MMVVILTPVDGIIRWLPRGFSCSREPLTYEPDYAPVADPMLCEPDQPFVAHPVEELTDVGIQYPVYVSAYQPCGQCVQCIVLASPGSEPV